MTKKELLIILILALLVTILTVFIWWGAPLRSFNEDVFCIQMIGGSCAPKMNWTNAFLDFLFWLVVLAGGWWILGRLKKGIHNKKKITTAIFIVLLVGAISLLGGFYFANRERLRQIPQKESKCEGRADGTDCTIQGDPLQSGYCYQGQCLPPRAVPQRSEQVQFFSGCSDIADLWSPLSEEERRQECVKILNEQTADLKNAGFEPKDCQLIEAEVAHCSPGLGVHLVCSYNCEKRSK